MVKFVYGHESLMDCKPANKDMEMCCRVEEFSIQLQPAAGRGHEQGPDRQEGANRAGVAGSSGETDGDEWWSRVWAQRRRCRTHRRSGDRNLFRVQAWFDRKIVGRPQKLDWAKKSLNCAENFGRLIQLPGLGEMDEIRPKFNFFLAENEDTTLTATGHFYPVMTRRTWWK